ncbi:unnamed protein product [Effrenium voratum]|nr:unnamed protein product [Effrenium voratum]
MTGSGFGHEFLQLCDAYDGIGLYNLLQTTTKNLAPRLEANDEVSAVMACTGETEEGLEATLYMLRKWSSRYMERTARVRWMLMPLLWLAAQSRHLAVKLDKDGSRRFRERMVEVARELFTKLQQDKDRREGALVICCELIRLYSSLGQASQCGFVLATVRAAAKHEAPDLPTGLGCSVVLLWCLRFDPVKLPKSLLVTLYFLWGKHSVMAGNVEEADEKLRKALALCPPKARGNRRRILSYLIPCRLRLGHYPTKGLLERNGLGSLVGIVAATATGNVWILTLVVACATSAPEELEHQEAEFINLGTYLVFEKLKLVVFRNLVRHVFVLRSTSLEGPQMVKQDLAPFERALRWQDGCTQTETLCLLAHLMYVGAVRGYLSDAHRKVVFSKDRAFPPVSMWANKTQVLV